MTTRALALLGLVACGGSEPRPRTVEQVPIHDDAPVQASAPVSTPAATPAASTPVPAGAGGDARVSRAECSKLFDKYIDLAVGGNAQLKDLGPELKGIIEQAKAQAAAEKGDPCATENVSRAQYDCAMSAKSTDAWQACLK